MSLVGVGRVDVKKLAVKIEAAQTILDEIRLESGCDAFGTLRVASQNRQETALETAIRAYAERQDRGKHFDSSHLFGEPAWDILLDLYIHQARNETVSVKSATMGSGASTMTALRWFQVLESEGLICSEEDPLDGRRRLLRLTAEGYESITRYLAEIAR